MTLPAAPVLDIQAAGAALLDAFVPTIEELAAGMTVEYNGTATPVSTAWSLPTRQGLAPGGQIVHEDEQLTVVFTDITRGLPGAPQAGFQPPATTLQFVTFELNLIRKVSGLDNSGRNPAPVIETADFNRLILDAELTWAALLQIQVQNLLVPTNTHFAYGPLITVGPEGVLAGLRCPVSFVWMQAKGLWTG